jgi:hypothetical protein
MKYRLSPEGRNGIDDYGYNNDIKNHLMNNTFDAHLVTPPIGMKDYVLYYKGEQVRLAEMDVIPVENLPEELFHL